MEVGMILVYTTPFPQYSYGDFVDLSGSLRREVTGFGKPKMSLMYPTIRVVDKEEFGGGFGLISLQAWLSRLRSRIHQNFSSFLPEPQASLLSGVVLGAKGRIPDDFLTALRRTGTIHVVVASGYNVTMVAGLLSALFLRFLSRRLAIPCVIVGIALYAMLAGADSPIIRASIMGSLAFIAQYFGRQYLAVWGLVAASLLMLVVSPFALFDVGFELSVAATAGILLVSPAILGLLGRVRWFGYIAEELAVTLGAQLAVLPILLIYFRQASWLSWLVNLLTVPLIPFLMVLGGVVAVTSLVWQELAFVGALLSWVPLTVFVSVVSWFDRLPFGVFQISALSWWWAIGYYLVLGYLVWRQSQKGRLTREDRRFVS